MRDPLTFRFGAVAAAICDHWNSPCSGAHESLRWQRDGFAGWYAAGARWRGRPRWAVSAPFSAVLPSTTATECGEGMFRDSADVRPGRLAHDPGHVARVILRALRTGEERIGI